MQLDRHHTARNSAMAPHQETPCPARLGASPRLLPARVLTALALAVAPESLELQVARLRAAQPVALVPLDQATILQSRLGSELRLRLPWSISFAGWFRCTRLVRESHCFACSSCSWAKRCISL